MLKSTTEPREESRPLTVRSRRRVAQRLLALVVAASTLLVGFFFVGLPALISRGYWLAPRIDRTFASLGLDIEYDAIRLQDATNLQIDGARLAWIGESEPWMTITRISVFSRLRDWPDKRIRNLRLDGVRYDFDLADRDRLVDLFRRDPEVVAKPVTFEQVAVGIERGVVRFDDGYVEFPAFSALAGPLAPETPGSIHVRSPSMNGSASYTGAFDHLDGTLRVREWQVATLLEVLGNAGVDIESLPVGVRTGVLHGELGIRRTGSVFGLDGEGEVRSLTIEGGERRFELGTVDVSMRATHEGAFSSALVGAETESHGVWRASLERSRAVGVAPALRVEASGISLERIGRDLGMGMGFGGRLEGEVATSLGSRDLDVRLGATELYAVGEDRSASGTLRAAGTVARGPAPGEWAVAGRGSVAGRGAIRGARALLETPSPFTLDAIVTEDGAVHLRELELEALLGGGTLAVEGRMDPSDEGSVVDLAFNLEQARLTAIAERLPWLRGALDRFEAGTLDARVDVEGPLSAPGLSAEVDFADVRSDAMSATVRDFEGSARIEPDASFETIVVEADALAGLLEIDGLAPIDPSGSLRLSYDLARSQVDVEALVLEADPFGQITLSTGIDLESRRVLESIVEAPSVPLDRLRRWLGETTQVLDDASLEGRTSMMLEAPDFSFDDPIGRLHLTADLDQVSLAFEEHDLIVEDAMGLASLVVDIGDQGGRFELDGRLDSFEALYGLIYRGLGAGEEAVRFGAEGRFGPFGDQPSIDLRRGFVETPDTGRASFEAVKDDVSTEYLLRLSDVPLARAYGTLFRDPRADTSPVLERIELDGTADVALFVRPAEGGPRVQGALRFEDARFAMPRLKLDGVSGHLPVVGTWARGRLRADTSESDDAAPGYPGFLSARSVTVGGTKVPGARWRLRASGDSLQLIDPIELPLYGGELVLTSLAGKRLFDGGRKVTMEIRSTPLRLSQICDAFDLRPIQGHVEFDLGRRVRISGHRVDLEGAVEVEAFGGTTRVMDVSIVDPYSGRSRVSVGRLEVEGLEIERLTRHHGIGLVSGAADVRVTDLVWEAGEPVSFDIDFQTVRRRGVPQLIRREGVLDIDRMLNGAASDSLSSTLSRLPFRNYRYSSFGFECSLEDGLFRLKGKTRSGGRDMLMAGPWYGIGGIEIVNSNPRPAYDWNTIWRNVRRTSTSGEQVDDSEN